LLGNAACGVRAFRNRTSIPLATMSMCLGIPRKNASVLPVECLVIVGAGSLRDIHRFRQALYLYFSGKDSGYLQRVVTDPNPAKALYQLGFWAEAISWSAEEQKEGLRGIQSDLMPILRGVEEHDAPTSKFFHQFHRVIVIDDLQDPTFLPARLGSFLKLEGEQHLDNGVLLYYVPRVGIETGPNGKR
jgi:hypothetical protein